MVSVTSTGPQGAILSPLSGVIYILTCVSASEYMYRRVVMRSVLR